eukprot:12402816-Karenia_brevis.AAC.1
MFPHITPSSTHTHSDAHAAPADATPTPTHDSGVVQSSSSAGVGGDTASGPSRPPAISQGDNGSKTSKERPGPY